MINSDKRGEWWISPCKNLLQEWKGVEICQDYKDFQCFIYIRSYDNSLDYTNLFKWGFIINIAMKMRLKIKNRSRRYDINTLRRRQGHKYTKYKMFVSILMHVLSSTKATFEAQFMKKLSNNEAQSKKTRCL